MSEIFEIHCQEKPEYEHLVNALKRDGLVHYGDLYAGNCNFYLDKVSSRGVSVSAVDNTIEVKIYSLSSPEDCALAIDIVEATARLFNGEIDSETRGEVKVEDLRDTFIYDEWLNNSAESGARVIAHLIDDGKGPMQIPGPVRDVYIGANALANFRKSGEKNLTKQFLDFVRRVQYIEKYECNASRFTATDKDEEITLCIWDGKKTIIPPVQFVMLSDDSEPPKIIKIKLEDLDKICPDHIHELDETQHILDACTPAEWTEIRQRAQKVEQTY